MDINPALLPDNSRAKSLVHEYADPLVCARYRDDGTRQKRFQTLEPILDEQDWMSRAVIPTDKRVSVQIGQGETALPEKIKSERGYRNADKKARHVGYKAVLRRSLDRRTIDDDLDL